MKFLMNDRASGEFVQMLCPVIISGERRYLDWGNNFRIPAGVSTIERSFGSIFTVGPAAVTMVSRNRLYLKKQDKEDDDIMLALHIVLPSGFKGKCIRGVSGRRIFYDYTDRSRYERKNTFSVRALVYLPVMESVEYFDMPGGSEEVEKKTVYNGGGDIVVI